MIKTVKFFSLFVLRKLLGTIKKEFE